LSGGRGRSRNSRVFYDNPDAPDYTYSVSGDLSAGPVTLTITRAKGGQLTVFDFYDGDLGIHLEDGDDQPGRVPRPRRPDPPAQQPGSPNRGDPLVIDLAGTGIQTYGLAQALHFDHDGDGFAEATGWAAAGSGVLVLDADADGVLDNGQELFGDFTRLPGGQLAVNGFQALSQYDRNRDGVIDANDPVWQHLRVAVWESGPRGETVLGDPTEAMSLKTLDELGIAAIGLDSAIATTTDANGNTRTRTGHITLAGGATRELAEYRFARDPAETKFLDWREVPESIAVLPELTLGGVQMDLTQAVVRNSQSARDSKIKAENDSMWRMADRALTPEQRKQGQANFSDEYLADRAAFLTWKNKLALLDKEAAAAPYTDAPDAWFRDFASNLTIHLGATTTDSTAKPRYLFGADQTSGVEMLEGGSNADRLYGGGGVDHLYGYGGHDHLEGGAGDDKLYGGDQDDVLVGGAGDDRLEGGRGFDTYIVGQGIDTIVDDDGLGVVKDGAGRLIAGAFIRGADGRYAWANDAVVTASHNSPLTITLENGAQVIIDNYDDFAEGESQSSQDGESVIGWLIGNAGDDTNWRIAA